MNYLMFDGRVERGEGMATKLGCPTANIAVEQGAIIPALGVYVGEAEFNGRLYPSLICINDGRTGYNLKMEVHLLNQKELDLNEKHLRVVLFKKFRDLVPYVDDEQMGKLIADDLTRAHKWFQRSSPPE